MAHNSTGRWATKLTYKVANSVLIDFPEYFDEYYAIYTSNTTAEPEAFTLAFEETLSEAEAALNFKDRELTLPEGCKYIAFRHFNISDKCNICIDDVQIWGKETGDDDPISLPYFENFQSTPLFVWPKGWSTVDADGDGFEWLKVYLNGPGGEDAPLLAASASWDVMTLSPDNWLITPLMPGVRSVVYDVTATNSSDFREHYSIMASSTTSEPAAFSTVFSETLTAAEGAADILEGLENMKPRGINVPAGTKYIAFRHHDCIDQFWLMLDNMLFSKDEVTSMNGVVADNINLYVLDGKLIVNASKNGLAIEVYSMDGRLAARSKSLLGRTEIELATGNYVVKVGGFTGKVSIK